LEISSLRNSIATQSIYTILSIVKITKEEELEQIEDLKTS